ncbi:hypothetical protein N5T62_05050 [Aliarcobacter cryaerophilus]|uniref:hypothetical protein n=1 Tax=Aliarcobacter cryaerophilus TaxID=28198 RepID=UPI0021B385A0|nr:hypothetical protein [Aliarcobacter cryaerophilus]MCT7505444.1 hypothetical protein [Aliarcobacter cryaerophilus]
MRNYINNISDLNFIKYTLAAVIALQFLTVFVLKSYITIIFFLSTLALVFIFIMILKTEKQKEEIEESDEIIEEE